MAEKIEGKSRYVLLALILLVLIGSACFLLQKDDPNASAPAKFPPVSETQSGKLPAPGLAASGVVPAAAGEDADKENVTAAQVNPPVASAAISAWQSSDAEPSTVALPDGVAIYEPVSIDMESPVFPEPGQQVTLGLPGGEVVNATVKSSNENPNGDYSWRGYLDGYGTDYPVIMTYGANSVFATVTTPKGSYTLVSVNGSGWIYKNPSEFELSHPGVEDHLEIPHQHK